MGTAVTTGASNLGAVRMRSVAVARADLAGVDLEESCPATRPPTSAADRSTNDTTRLIVPPGPTIFMREPSSRLSATRDRGNARRHAHHCPGAGLAMVATWLKCGGTAKGAARGKTTRSWGC